MAKKFLMLMQFLYSVFGPLPNLLVLHCVDDAILSTLCRLKQVKKKSFWREKTPAVIADIIHQCCALPYNHHHQHLSAYVPF